jgi:hypothetical protein
MPGKEDWKPKLRVNERFRVNQNAGRIGPAPLLMGTLGYACGEVVLPPGEEAGGQGLFGPGAIPGLLGLLPPFALPGVDGLLFGVPALGAFPGVPFGVPGKLPHGAPEGEVPFGVFGLTVDGCVVLPGVGEVGVVVPGVDPGVFGV